MIADPTATGEILGADAYRHFAEPALATLIAGLRAAGTPVILHICGCPNVLMERLAGLTPEAISLDETADLHAARRCLSHRLTGNISADLLDSGPPESILANARAVLKAGVDILAPACGITATTSVAHLRLLAEAGRGGTVS
jgi:uroporphyrinogen-III decarboxylase